MVAAIVLQMNVHFDRILNLLGQVLVAGLPAMNLTLSRQMGIPYGGSARGTVLNISRIGRLPNVIWQELPNNWNGLSALPSRSGQPELVTTRYIPRPRGRRDPRQVVRD
jgi:hypothetical protein